MPQGKALFDGRAPGTNIVLDTFCQGTSTSHHYVISHCHFDHLKGIHGILETSNSSPFTIHCTSTTADLLRARVPKLRNSTQILIKAHALNETFILEDKASSSTFSVTLLDANHCPGAAMVFIASEDETILYTGDFRFSWQMLEYDCFKLNGFPDTIIFDSTFFHPGIRFPTKAQSLQALVRFLETHRGNHRFGKVYLSVDCLGSEEVIIYLSSYFECKIFIDSETLRSEQLLILESTKRSIVTKNPESAWIHIVSNKGFERLGKSKVLSEPDSLFVKPSALWFFKEELKNSPCRALLPDIVQKDGVLTRVLFSMHSDFYEIRDMLCKMRPKSIIPTLLPIGFSSVFEAQSCLSRILSNYGDASLRINVSGNVRKLRSIAILNENPNGKVDLFKKKRSKLFNYNVHICENVPLIKRHALLRIVSSLGGNVCSSDGPASLVSHQTLLCVTNMFDEDFGTRFEHLKSFCRSKTQYYHSYIYHFELLSSRIHSSSQCDITCPCNDDLLLFCLPTPPPSHTTPDCEDPCSKCELCKVWFNR